MNFFYFDILESTNSKAKELLPENNVVVVTCGYQTKGRGRNTNIWVGEHNDNLYYSLGLCHEYPLSLEDVSLFQASACLAVKSILTEITNNDIFKIKYPNDVYVAIDDNYKKISGILIENSFSGSACTSSIIGIGINVNQKDFGDLNYKATSMFQLGINISPNILTSKLTEELIRNINKENDIIRSEWLNELSFGKKIIKVSGESGSWMYHELLDDGRLVLISESGKHKIIIDNGDSILYEL